MIWIICAVVAVAAAYFLFFGNKNEKPAYQRPTVVFPVEEVPAEQPPADNAHVAEGATPFPEPVEPTPAPKPAKKIKS